MCEGWKTKYRFPDGRASKQIEYSLCEDARGDRPCKSLRVWKQPSQEVPGVNSLGSTTTSPSQRTRSNTMADSESLRPYEPAKEEPSLKPHQSRKPWKRRSSVSHEERGPKQSLSSILPWNYKRKEEEKRASRRKDKSPPRILHLHRHYTYSPGPSAEAPNPPAAAAWLPSPRLPPDEVSLYPAASPSSIGTSLLRK